MTPTSRAIEVASAALVHQLNWGLEQSDCADWSIYVRMTGAVACQPHASEHRGWHEVVSMRAFADLVDSEGRCRSDVGFDAGALATWIVQEHQSYLPSTVDIDGDTVAVMYVS